MAVFLGGLSDPSSLLIPKLRSCHYLPTDFLLFKNKKRKKRKQITSEEQRLRPLSSRPRERRYVDRSRGPNLL